MTTELPADVSPDAYAMAMDLTPGFYRDEDNAFLVDEAGAIWLVESTEPVDQPIRLDDEQVGVVPFYGIDPDDAAEYRRMVDEASAGEGALTWRQRPPML